ncbi:MAG: hypothetical protein AAF569_06845, partial [Pseudomonadota bacterium]
IIDSFVSTWTSRIKRYFKNGGRDENATKSDLKDILGTVSAISKDPDATAQIDFVTHTDGKKEQKTVFKFQTADAKIAQQELEKHIYELEKTDSVEFKRVTMVFVRPDSSSADIGKRSGEKVVIEEIGPDPKPLIYSSDLAEQKIKHELRSAESNVFKMAFIVDANIELRNSRPWAYRVHHVHQVIPIEE